MYWGGRKSYGIIVVNRLPLIEIVVSNIDG